MSSTGPIETWNVNPTDIGPIYPFVGSETLMFAACVVFCVAFFIWKFVTETAKYTKAAQSLREPNALENALAMNSTGDQPGVEINQVE